MALGPGGWGRTPEARNFYLSGTGGTTVRYSLEDQIFKDKPGINWSDMRFDMEVKLKGRRFDNTRNLVRSSVCTRDFCFDQERNQVDFITAKGACAPGTSTLNLYSGCSVS